MLTTPMPTTVIPLDDLSSLSSSKRLSTSTERAKSKLSTATSATSKFTAGGRRKENQKPIHETDVDMENLPVIQGSFEITKTDADIAQKRSDASQRTASTVSLAANTLKPFYISPASSIKIKSSERLSTTTPTIRANANESILEMFFQHQKQQLHQKIKEPAVTAKIEKTNKNGETTIDKSTTEPATTTTTTTTTSKPFDYEESQMNKDLPKLAPSLFTSPPVLDNEPWRPINPSPSQIKVNFPATLTTEASDSTTTDSPDDFRGPFNPYPPENVMYRNKFVDPETLYDTNDTDSVFYQSFYNPDFSAGDLAIEKLGVADVKPYPLPVNKIDLNENKNVPEFKPLETGESDDVKMNYDEDKFEHLGGGVIAKKPEAMNETVEDEAEMMMMNVTEEAPTELGDIFQELLDLDEAALNLTKSDDNQLESRVEPDDDESSTEIIINTTTERLNFMNMKDFIVHMQKNKSDEDDFETISTVRTTEKPTTTFVEVETLKYTPAAVAAVATQPQLFPIKISKWEFVNGTQTNVSETSMTRKVFNETLQAVVVENSQTSPPHASRFDDLKANRTIDKANLQQLSSIFDTLAAKLGIKPIDLASKSPPFSQHNKQKNNSNRTRMSSTTTKRTKLASTTPISRQRPTTIKLSATTKLTTARPTTKMEVVTVESSSEVMVGQAEVEPVDPTKYEEILSLISSSPVTRIESTTPSLVTLLPVKSNSGIRNFNPRIKSPTHEENRKLEAVVKASMSFDA